MNSFDDIISDQYNILVFAVVNKFSYNLTWNFVD